jgi:RNA polymerase sigma-70 factor (ECF subfamily)
MSDSDAKLIARFRSGDETVLTEIFERYERPLFHFLCGILRNHHQAEDALQETMIRALEHIEDVAVNLKSWLFTVATNQAMLLKRRKKVQFCSVDDESEGVSDADPGPSLTAEMNDDAQRLRELLDHLVPAQREVIRQRIYEGKKFREIAETLGCPLNTVLARMHEGLKKLRSLWEQNKKGCVPGAGEANHAR